MLSGAEKEYNVTTLRRRYPSRRPARAHPILASFEYSHSKCTVTGCRLLHLSLSRVMREYTYNANKKKLHYDSFSKSCVYLVIRVLLVIKNLRLILAPPKPNRNKIIFLTTHFPESNYHFVYLKYHFSLIF